MIDFSLMTKIQLSVLAVLLFYSNLTSAHGYVVNSRAHGCTQLEGHNKECGIVSDLPQYVLGMGRFPNSGPRDGKLASAEIAEFSQLDVQNDTRWYKHTITNGPIQLIWAATISHPTTEFRYFLTKQNWNQNVSLKRSSFNLNPFCRVIVNQSEIPFANRHNCTIPSDYSGYHVIYATWDTTNEELGFYQVFDVNIVEITDNIFSDNFGK